MIRKVENISPEQLEKLRKTVGEAFVSNESRDLMIKPRILYSNLYTSVIKSVCEKYPLMLYIGFSRFVFALAYDLAYAVYGLRRTLYHISSQYNSVPIQFLIAE